jgi:transcriptional regulator with XRE-family HTH domain
MRARDLVALNIRRIRVAQGVSQERLAFDSGVDRGYLSGLERSEENPTVDLLDRLAETLQSPVRDFFQEPAPGENTAPTSLKRGRKARQ